MSHIKKTRKPKTPRERQANCNKMTEAASVYSTSAVPLHDNCVERTASATLRLRCCIPCKTKQLCTELRREGLDKLRTRDLGRQGGRGGGRAMSVRRSRSNDLAQILHNE